MVAIHQLPNLNFGCTLRHREYVRSIQIRVILKPASETLDTNCTFTQSLKDQ